MLLRVCFVSVIITACLFISPLPVCAAELRFDSRGDFSFVQDGGVLRVVTGFPPIQELEFGGEFAPTDQTDRQVTINESLDVNGNSLYDLKIVWNSGVSLERRLSFASSPNRELVYWRDTWTNHRDAELFLPFEYQFSLPGSTIHLGGNSEANLLESSPFNPTLFLGSDSGAGFGWVAEDNWLRNLLRFSKVNDAAKTTSHNLLLSPNGSISFEMSLYALCSGSYWDFINRVRSDWGVNDTSLDLPIVYGLRSPLGGDKPVIQVTGGGFIGLDWDTAFLKKSSNLVDMRGLSTAEKEARAQSFYTFNHRAAYWGDRRKILITPFHDNAVPGSKVLMSIHPAMEIVHKPTYLSIYPFSNEVMLSRSGIPFERLKYTSDFLANASGCSSADPNCAITEGWGVLFVSPGAGHNEEFLARVSESLSGETGAPSTAADGIYCDEFNFASMRRDYSRYDYRDWDGYSVVMDAVGAHKATDNAVKSKELQLALFAAVVGSGKTLLVNGAPNLKEIQKAGALHFAEFGNGSWWPVNQHLTTPLMLGNAGSQAANTVQALFNQSKELLRRGTLHVFYKPIDSVLSQLEPNNFIVNQYPISPQILGDGFVIGRERVITTTTLSLTWPSVCGAVKLSKYDLTGAIIGTDTVSLLEDGINQLQIATPEGGMTIAERIENKASKIGNNVCDFDAHYSSPSLPKAYSISGKVTLAGNPLSDVVVDGGLLGAQITDDEGRYTFRNVPHGSEYRVNATKEGYVIVGEASGILVSDTSVDFSSSIATHTLSGTVRSQGMSIADVVVYGGSIGFSRTDTEGRFVFRDIPYGTSYSLVPAKYGHSFSPLSYKGIVSRDLTLDFTVGDSDGDGLPDDIEETDPEILSNPGFEERNPDSNQSDDFLPHWAHSSSPIGSGTELIVEGQDCYTGRCAMLTLGHDSTWSGLMQRVGSLIPGEYYVLSVKTKAAVGRDAVIRFYDEDWKDNTGKKVGKKFQKSLAGTGRWSSLDYLFQVPYVDDSGENTALHRWRIYLIGYYYSDEAAKLEPIYYDEVSLSLFKHAFAAGNCQNSSFSTCLDFGPESIEAKSNIIYQKDKMSENFGMDGTVTYRNLKAKQELEVTIPAFNVDEKGLPLTPMLLEVSFRDTYIDQPVVHVRSQRRVFLKSYTGYRSSDPEVPADKEWVSFGSIGGAGDAQWRVKQFVFSKTQFQLLRAVDGKFRIRMTMPTRLLEDETLELPIDYLALTAITEQRALEINKRWRDFRHFYETELSLPQGPLEPLGDALIVYVPDLMKPVLPSTKPLSNEILDGLFTASAPGVTEPLSFALYSKQGIDGLDITVSPIVSEDRASEIAAEAIKTFRAVADYKRLTHDSRHYALVPDRLEPFSALNVEADTSERIWIKIRIPEDQKPGIYRGSLTVSQRETPLVSLSLTLKVVGVTLPPSPSLNNSYGDPVGSTIGVNFSRTTDFYSDLNVVPFIQIKKTLIDSSGDGLLENSEADFIPFVRRLEKLEENRMTAGQMLVQLDHGIWNSIVQALFGRNYPADRFYEFASDEAFKRAYGEVITKLVKIGQEKGISFIFSVTDEPDEDPLKRVIADRLYTLIKEVGGKTTVTYSVRCDLPVDGTQYGIQQIPALTNLVDYKVWKWREVNEGYKPSEGAPFGYYTTGLSNLRIPLYTRFLHGIFAYRTGASIVSSYALADWVVDPYDDFDPAPEYVFPFTYPDFLLAYPTWGGDLLLTFDAEGTREGIKDARYLAYLEELIARHETAPEAENAKVYLQRLKSRISTNFKSDYADKATEQGFFPEILKSVSENDKADDFAAFTKVRQEVLGFIEKLLPYEKTYTLSGRVTENGVGLAGVLIVEASLGTTVTDKNGFFQFSELAFGTNYRLRAIKKGYTISPESRTGILTEDTAADFNAVLERYTLSGRVMSVRGGVSGVVIAGGALGNRMTDAEGRFAFTEVVHGTPYTLVAEKAGYTFTPESRTGILTENTVADFTGFVHLPLFSISGIISSAGKPLEGIIVDGGRLGTQKTDYRGEYLFSNVMSGTHFSIFPVGQTFTFSPERYSGVLTENMIVNFAVADSDGDGVTDDQELVDGSNPYDRGSVLPVLSSNLCAEWNGFLGMWNILEHVNMSSFKLRVISTLYDMEGRQQGRREFVVSPGAQLDLIVHDMPGWSKDSYGRVCSSVIGGSDGDLDGRMVYYKPKKDDSSSYEFAFAMPFENGVSGRQFVSFNTFQPSFAHNDSGNLVANWIQLSNLSDTMQVGALNFYSQEGEIIGGPINVELKPGARTDFSGHKFGRNLVGIVEWNPEDRKAKFQLRNVRYYYDNPEGRNSFDSAYQLEGMVGTGETIGVPLDTKAASAVLEIANIDNDYQKIMVDIYDESGTLLLVKVLNLAPFASAHLIADPVLKGGRGLAVVKGSVAEGVIAVALQYGRDNLGSLKYVYGIVGKEALGTTLRGSYNSFLNQSCHLLLNNLGAEVFRADVSMLRYDGSAVLSGVELALQPYASRSFNLCSKDATDKYGVVTLLTERPNSFIANVLRVGANDDYRFPTPVRQ